jgi:RNA polymerase sigma factor (sigma-70 family)
LSDLNINYQTTESLSAHDGNTIIDAAMEVLNQIGRPLNEEEIFAKIVDRGLFNFNAKKPVSVLSVELNRYSENTTYSKPAATPLLRKIGEKTFFPINLDILEPEDWLIELEKSDADLFIAAGSYEIHSENSFISNLENLDAGVRKKLEVFRFKILSKELKNIDKLTQWIKILPSQIRTLPISSFYFPLRIQNVFAANSISKLDDLSEYSVVQIMRWPNFGKKSLHDMATILFDEIDNRIDDFANTETSDQKNYETSINPLNENEENTSVIELASKKPLKIHFKEALARLGNKERQVIQARTAVNGELLTLEAVGDSLGVTRERIRQIQKKYVAQIIETEYWDDCIALKIGQLLIDRKSPLFLEMLEIEDPWFAGFMDNYIHLASIIELFSENEIRIIKVSGRFVVTRITSDIWLECISYFRKQLKEKSKSSCWTRFDTNILIDSKLNENRCKELRSLVWNTFNDDLIFDGDSEDSILIGFGSSAETAINAVMTSAEKPLHYSEVAKRASEILGKEVDTRRAQAALQNLNFKLFGRGIYGDDKFNPIPANLCNSISLVVTEKLYDGPLKKQWHSNEILSMLRDGFSGLPSELNEYILNIILFKNEKLTYLNRMVWARSDSKQTPNDRVDMADAFTQILEKNGRPLKGSVIKEKLKSIRGVSEKLQLQPTERMIQIGPDYWGLIDRDIPGTKDSHEYKLNVIYDLLKERGKGIHVTELENYIDVGEYPSSHPSSYAIMNLAQRDERFYLAQSMYLGLSDWGEDTRRLNISQAVKKLVGNMSNPMSIEEIEFAIEDLIEMPLKGRVHALLYEEGAFYDQGRRLWFKDGKG